MAKLTSRSLWHIPLTRARAPSTCFSPSHVVCASAMLHFFSRKCILRISSTGQCTRVSLLSSAALMKSRGIRVLCQSDGLSSRSDAFSLINSKFSGSIRHTGPAGCSPRLFPRMSNPTCAAVDATRKATQGSEFQKLTGFRLLSERLVLPGFRSITSDAFVPSLVLDTGERRFWED